MKSDIANAIECPIFFLQNSPSSLQKLLRQWLNISMMPSVGTAKGVSDSNCVISNVFCQVNRYGRKEGYDITGYHTLIWSYGYTLDSIGERFRVNKCMR